MANPPSLVGTVRFDDSIAQVSVSSVVPLLLHNWVKEADVWAVLLCMLILGAEGRH